MKKLEALIKNEINEKGAIPFSRFMELCLYHPQFGYYRKKNLPIGKYGDYYTSPTVHRFFGYMVARQLIEICQLLESDEILFVEAGAGRGHLARDIGEYLKTYEKSLSERVNLLIIEPHQPYRHIQWNETKDFYKNVDYIDTVSELPNFVGVFYSNELFDAFPVDIIENSGNGLKEIFVAYNDEGFYELKKELENDIKTFIENFSITLPAEDNFRTEISPQAIAFYSNVAAHIKEGAILTIDYGYSMDEYLSSSRNRGTLMCYYRHQAISNPYERVGMQDITAHVNFSLLKKVGEGVGLSTKGYVEQQYFIMGAGFVEEVEKLKKGLAQEQFEEEIQKIKILIMPNGMGNTFKFFLQTKGLWKDNFCGFQYRNKKDSL